MKKSTALLGLFVIPFILALQGCVAPQPPPAAPPPVMSGATGVPVAPPAASK